MRILSARARRHTSRPGVRVSSTGRGSLRTPAGFEAIGEVLASGRDPSAALTTAGVALAGLGVPLAESLADLRATTMLTLRREPTYAEVTAFSVAWGDAMLGVLAAITCEDPLTGLSSRAHLRTALAEHYARPGTAERVAEALAMVVVESRHSLEAVSPPGLGRAMWLGDVATRVRTVFTGDPMGRIGTDRVAVLAGRDPALGRRVALLRTMLDDLAGDGLPARVWIEGLPLAERDVDLLLDELSRN